MSKKILNGINVTGGSTFNTVSDAGVNTNKFLVLNSSNLLAYRTSSELLSDLSAASSGTILSINGTSYDISTNRSWSVGTVTSVAISMPSAFNVSGPVTGSGTISITGAGTTSQYINGAGGLTTFPSLTGYVPYTGATNDVDLGTHKLTLTDEQFNPSSAPSYSEGEVWYDSTQKALAYYNDVTNNTLHIGQEVQLKVYNNTGSTIVKGAPVYITSTNSGFTYPLVALAKADTLTTANVIGVANQDIPTSTAGYIVLSGLVSNISTGSYTVGTVLYLSPYSAGQLMSTVPPTGYAVRVGVVSYSNSPNGSIYINQSNAYSTAASIVGTIQISQGGTGATTAAGALTNLGAAASSRLISTTTPLQGGGDLTADRTLSILQAGTSQSGYLSSTDWNTFNNKQNALGYVPVGGSGSVNYISKFTGSTTISNSGIYEGVAGKISINNTNTTYALDVTGVANFSNSVYAATFITNSASGILIGTDGSGNGGSLLFTQNTSTSVGGPGQSSISTSSTNIFRFQAGISSGVYKAFQFDNSGLTNNITRTYTMPDASGTLALTSQLSGVIYGSGSTYQVAWFNATNSIGGSSNLYFDPTNNRLGINQSTPLYSLDVTGTARITGNAIFGGTLGNGTYNYTLPSATGTLALTSNLSSYVPYSGATGSLYMGSSYLVSAKAFVTSGSGGGAYLKLLNALTAATPESDGVKLSSVGSVDLVISSNTYNSTLVTSGNTADRTYTFPNASGTIALTSQIPSLSGTAPISYSAGVISISQATNASNGYLTSTDWTTFNNKQAALGGTGLVKSTAGSITYITDNSSSWNSGSAIANSLNGVSPINFNSITGAISISQANTSTNGYLSSTDWNTFNGKQNALTNPVTGTGTSNYVSKFTGTSTLGNGLIYDNGSGVTVNSTTVTRVFNVYSATADNHVLIAGSAPSVSLADALSGATYQAKFGLATAANQFVTNAAAGDFAISSQGTSSILWGVNGTEAMRIFGSTKNVAIGSSGTDAGYKLDVNGTGRFTGALTIAGLTSTGTISLTPSSFAVGSSTAVDANSLTLQAANSNYLLRFRNAAGTSLGGFYYDGTNFVADGPSWKFGNAAIFSSSVTATGQITGASFNMPSTGNPSSTSWTLLHDQNYVGDFGIYAGSNNRLSILANGNIGIGTNVPSYGLDILGTTAAAALLRVTYSGYAQTFLQAFNGIGYVGTLTNDHFAISTNSTEKVRITSGGNVLIGTTSESSLISSGLQVTNSASGGPGQLVLHNTGATSTYYWTMGQNSGNAFIVYGYNGSSFSSGVYMTWGATSWTGNSDIRLKNIIKPIDNAVNKLLTLNPIIFSWKSDENNKENLGLIAQDVEKVFPQIVDMQDDKIGTKGVRYTDLIPVLVKAIQEQQAQIEELKSLINK